MIKTSQFCIFFYGLLILALLIPAPAVHAAAPPAPVPVSPAEDSEIVIPTFNWLAAPGAAYYELEVGPQNNPLNVYWSDQTPHLTLTPDNSADFPNEALYWRVRGYDSSDTPGDWSDKVNFTKLLPPPATLWPSNGMGMVTPLLGWTAVTGAARYKVEISLSNTFIPITHTYITYNLTFIPVDAIAHSTNWYWRVTSLDAEGNEGAPSPGQYFQKTIESTSIISPASGAVIAKPTLRWNSKVGAAYYVVELSLSNTFNPIAHTYTTYNTQITPVTAIDHNAMWYWRVTGADAAGHLGIPCCGLFNFNKTILPPILTYPDDGSNMVNPRLTWEAADGAAYYKVELSLVSNFNPIAYTYTTYNTELNPVDKLPNATYYWRVSGVDAEGYVGTPSTTRTFIQLSLPVAINPAPLLVLPADGADITSDPTFCWEFSVGASDYRLKVSRTADFASIYDSTYTDYSAFTPYTYGTSGVQDAYANGTYYWKVDARDDDGTVIATSEARTFTKTQALPLNTPGDGVTLTSDPTYTWDRIVGARDYRVKVSKTADFASLYDSSYTDYSSFTPYTYLTSGIQDAYPNGTYYWKVDARDDDGTVIATSEARSFTKTAIFNLNQPANSAALTDDPAFTWSWFTGARDYRVKISRTADFASLYDSAYTDYPAFRPYTYGTSGVQDNYTNGTYYWKVDARDDSGTVLVTSETRTFTKNMPLSLLAPVNGGLYNTEPTFQWSPVVGARDYRVKVSVNANMSPLYDSVYTDYPIYTPYHGPGVQDFYAPNVYYWQVEARDDNGTVITTSTTWSFEKAWTVFLPVVRK